MNKLLMKRTALISLIIFGIWPTLSKAQQVANSVEMLNLDSILQRIDTHNIKLKSYALKGSAYHYKAKAATAWMAPMVGAGTFMTPYPGQSTMPDQDKGSFMFRFEQDIPNPGKQKAQATYITSQESVELANRDVDLNELRAQAKNLYYTWLIAEKRMLLLKEDQTLIHTLKQIESIRYEYNQSTLGSVFKADAKLEENENMMEMQKAEIARSRAWLNSLMNREGMYPFEIDTVENHSFQRQLSLDTTLLANKRGDIKRIDATIRNMQYGISAMKSESKPNFKLQFDHMSALSSMMPNAYSIMGMISIPIAPWSSKQYKNEIKAMQLNQEAMQQEREGMLLESQGMLYGMQQEILAIEQRIDRMETKIIPALQKAMDANFQSYKENKQSLPSVLADWEALNMMKNSLLDEQLKRYQMIVSYEKELYQ